MVERRQTIAGRLCKSDGGERIPADFPDFPAQTQRVSTAAGVLCIMLRATRLNHTMRSDVHVSHITNNIISANAAN